MKKLSLIITIFALTLVSCENQNVTSKSESKQKNKSNETQSEDIKKSNFELLQGKWVHEDDKSNFLVFEKNIRKEIADRMETWDEEEFVLSDKCENESNLSNTSEREKDSYISCKNSDLCWYILSVSEENLTLQYKGRENILKYTRVK